MNRVTIVLRLGLIAVLAVVVNSCSTVSQEAPQYVWWEGESPTETNFPANSWFAASGFPETRDLLSEGDWLSNSGDRMVFVAGKA